MYPLKELADSSRRTVEPLVPVESSMSEVLECICQHHRQQELQNRNNNKVHQSGDNVVPM